MPRLKKAVEAVEDADIAVSEAVAHQRHRPLVKVAGLIGEIGDQPPLVALSAAVILAGAARTDRRMLRVGVRMLLAHALATGAKTVIKRSIDRTRPDHALDTSYRRRKGNSKKHELSSFPSGHTAGAVAVAQAIARDYPDAALPARGVAVAVAAVQIPRCKHFMSDIAVGALIGLAAERLASLVVDSVAKQNEGHRP